MAKILEMSAVATVAAVGQLGNQKKPKPAAQATKPSDK